MDPDGREANNSSDCYIGPGTKKPSPSWWIKVDNALSRFAWRNFGFMLPQQPDTLIGTMDGRLIPLTESGVAFSNKEKNLDAAFFCATTFFAVFKLTKTINLAAGATRSIDLNTGSQGKHIVNHPNYMEGRSIIYGDLDDAQKLLDKFSGTGTFISENKERVNFGRVIGAYVNPETKALEETTWGIIHYGKNRAHIVPSNPCSY